MPLWSGVGRSGVRETHFHRPSTGRGRTRTSLLTIQRSSQLDILAEQKQAVRGVLYLYWELATNWGGIDGEAEFCGFDRWRWLQCEADYDGGVWRSHDDTLLLRQGSAVALLCEMNNEWDHYDEVD